MIMGIVIGVLVLIVAVGWWKQRHTSSADVGNGGNVFEMVINEAYQDSTTEERR